MWEHCYLKNIATVTKNSRFKKVVIYCKATFCTLRCRWAFDTNIYAKLKPNSKKTLACKSDTQIVLLSKISRDCVPLSRYVLCTVLQVCCFNHFFSWRQGKIYCLCTSMYMVLSTSWLSFFILAFSRICLLYILYVQYAE